MTRYVVLLEERDENGSSLTMVGEVEARTDKAATDAVMKAMHEPPASADFVVVPKRHWHRLSVKTSVQTKFEIT